MSERVDVSVLPPRPIRAGLFASAGLACLLILAPDAASASPIRAHRLSVATPPPSRFGPAWSRFLAGGPSLWEVRRAPAIPSHLVLAVQNGLLVPTPFVDYLLWRRTLDPTRFDRYHPRIGPELSRLSPSIALTNPPFTRPVPVPLVLAPTPSNPQAQLGTPEPGSFAVLLVLAGAFGAYQRRRGAET
jgi:hypothetical protein